MTKREKLLGQIWGPKGAQTVYIVFTGQSRNLSYPCKILCISEKKLEYSEDI